MVYASPSEKAAQASEIFTKEGTKASTTTSGAVGIASLPTELLLDIYSQALNDTIPIPRHKDRRAAWGNNQHLLVSATEAYLTHYLITLHKQARNPHFRYRINPDVEPEVRVDVVYGSEFQHELQYLLPLEEEMVRKTREKFLQILAAEKIKAISEFVWNDVC